MSNELENNQEPKKLDPALQKKLGNEAELDAAYMKGRHQGYSDNRSPTNG